MMLAGIVIGWGANVVYNDLFLPLLSRKNATPLRASGATYP